MLRQKFQTPLATALPDAFQREPSFAEEVFGGEKKAKKKLVAYRFAAGE